MLSWLMFIATGVSPYSGQAVHFTRFAPEPKTYAVNRDDFEAWRHWKNSDRQLAEHRDMLGEAYTRVDTTVWGWARAVPFVLGAAAWEQLPDVKRLLDEINARPAVQRAEALKSKHAFKVDMDDEARAEMFPQDARLNAWTQAARRRAAVAWQHPLSSARGARLARSRSIDGRQPLEGFEGTSHAVVPATGRTGVLTGFLSFLGLSEFWGPWWLERVFRHAARKGIHLHLHLRESTKSRRCNISYNH